MNKDALFATLIGLAIGLLLTGIILVGPSIAKSLPQVKFPAIANITLPKISLFSKNAPTPTQPANASQKHDITIDSPLADSIETQNTVLISGVTSKNATVIIQGLTDDSVVNANGDGKYAGKITLSEGKNDIQIISYSTTKEQAMKQVTVFYSPETW